MRAQAQDAGSSAVAVSSSASEDLRLRDDPGQRHVSATALWKAVGQAGGLDAANERFGLTDTEGGDGLHWGLTQTTAADQLVLLQQVFGGDDTSEPSAASRAYVQELIGTKAKGISLVEAAARSAVSVFVDTAGTAGTAGTAAASAATGS